MVWILTQYYTEFGDTVSLFLFINACLDVLRLRDVMDHDRLARHVWERYTSSSDIGLGKSKIFMEDNGMSITNQIFKY